MAAPDLAPAVGTCLPRLPDGSVDVRESARRLLGDLLAHPWGQVSPSVYETGRLVRLAPWLSGHTARVRFLLANQRADGGWGGPGGYGLVPTLSATDALLSALADTTTAVADGPPRESLFAAARRGVAAAVDRLDTSDKYSIPDTPAIEIIVPCLVASLNAQLDDTDTRSTSIDELPTRRRLLPPVGMDGAPLTAVRAALTTAAELPAKLLHSLEVAGLAAEGARIGLPPQGLVGASPAATAAWLGRAGTLDRPAALRLEQVIRRFGGPVPSVLPITVFERAWVVGGLAAAGIDVAIPTRLVHGLRAAVAESGTPGGDGLPPDADTTGAVVHTLGRLGIPAGPDCLWPFEMDDHFCTWQGERTPSTTTNAHVLDALWIARNGGSQGGHNGHGTPAGVNARASTAERVRSAAKKVAGWLCEQQLQDGSWIDKWHASPYYATSCCALALARHGGARAAVAVRRAAGFILDSQRSDGSWGRWAGSMEETAYALQTLLGTGVAGDAALPALGRGYTYLLRAENLDQCPPLWHDKDLYAPVAVVRAAILVALHAVQTRPDIVTQAR